MVDGLTLAELAETAAALLGDEGDGEAGRVRPTQRTLRYYAAQRLLDPPLELRGPRSAYYGHRHLLQVVAVKKLQAAGRSLEEIRGLLAGASNERLQELAGAEPARVALTPALAEAEMPSLAAAEMPPADDALRSVEPPGATMRPSAFWRVRPDAAPPAAQVSGTDSRDDQAPQVNRDATGPQVNRDATGPLLTGVPVGPVVVLLPAVRPLDLADVSALVDAARPLLAALADRGLLTSLTSPAKQRSTP